MIVKELKDKDQIIKDVIDSEPGRIGYFVYPESPVEESLVQSLISNLRRCFDPRFQVLSALYDFKAVVDSQVSRLQAGDSSMLRPKGSSAPSDADKDL